MFKYNQNDILSCWRSEHNLSNFSKVLKKKWDELHDKPDIFRYKINKLEERYLDNRFFLQLNPDRGVKRRIPEEIADIRQALDPHKFNFTKVSPQEIILRLVNDDENKLPSDAKDDNIHQMIVNVSPISRYHTLFCPSVTKCLPQIATKQSLQMALEIIFLAQDRDLRIAFNSLCAFASVNHLHYHLLWLKENIAVEKVKCHPLTSSLHYFDDSYPAPAFCFQIINASSIGPITDDVYKLITFLLDKNVAHNILVTRGDGLECVGEVVRVCVWPRRSSFGVKHLSDFNVAAYELGGYFACYSPEVFHKLQMSDIERELKKWRFEAFRELCNEVKDLFSK